ncbi:hypothetical protein KW830_08340 [Comamonas sp. CMM03]|nr:hypothetical protein [Comamonas sp. CMM03]
MKVDPLHFRQTSRGEHGSHLQFPRRAWAAFLPSLLLLPQACP